MPFLEPRTRWGCVLNATPSLLLCVLTVRSTQPTVDWVGTSATCSGVKRTESKADRLAASNAEKKWVEVYFHSTITVYGLRRDNFTFASFRVFTAVGETILVGHNAA